jgi:outer membrane protein OmpA-like peptidoglycan-associated protein
MKAYVRLLSALTAVGAIIFAAPTPAHAENFSLHLEPGLAVPLTTPQATNFDTGLVLGAKGLFLLNRNLAVGPSVSAAYLPRATNTNNNAGVLWQFGGSLRLQGDHEKNWFSPWVDVDAMYARTGNLDRPAGDVGLGIDFTTDAQHAFWIGPFVRYTHVFQTDTHQDTSLLDSRDINLLQVGASFTFDFPPMKKVVNHYSYADHYRFVVVHDAAPPSHDAVATTAPEHFDLTQHVYFDWDKSVLRWESRDKLDEVARALNKAPNLVIHVQGHASSDGQLAHNEKLAQARTQAVVDYLVHTGHVDANRLKAESYGVDRPFAPNTSKEGRERNRRVEFEINFTSDNK